MLRDLVGGDSITLTLAFAVSGDMRVEVPADNSCTDENGGMVGWTAMLRVMATVDVPDRKGGNIPLGLCNIVQNGLGADETAPYLHADGVVVADLGLTTQNETRGRPKGPAKTQRAKDAQVVCRNGSWGVAGAGQPLGGR